MFGSGGKIRLKLFFVSLLWRASVSKLKCYAPVALGEYECVAKTLLTDRVPGNAQQFAVFLAKFDRHLLAEAIICPFREKIDGINYYRFYLGGYVAYIKADQRNVPREFSELIMAQGQPLKIIMQDLNRRQEFSRMLSIGRAYHNR